MKFELQHKGIALVFSIWVLPRILPLILYPGIYSFDAWVHLGYVETILVDNRIPILDPIENTYFSTPFLHIFAILLCQLLGIPLLGIFRLFVCFLVLVSFLAFFVLFRSLFGNGWKSITSMLLFTVAVDVIAQTNAVIPEHFALTFLALILLSSLKIIQQNKNKTQWILILPALILTLTLSHPLTAFFGILFALALFVASTINQNTVIQKLGIIVSLSLLMSLFGILIFVSPVMINIFRRYSLLIISGLTATFLIGFGLYYKRVKIWTKLEILKSNFAIRLFPIIGFITGLLFFASTLIFYPYTRPTLWVFFKFGFFACLFGFSISIANIMQWQDRQTRIYGAFILLSALFIGISFSYTAIINVISVEIGRYVLEVGFSHRHLAFLAIPFAVMATIALNKIYHKSPTSGRFYSSRYPIILTLILIIFSAGGIYNLYAPIGGWYPEWCDNSEINTGYWLNDIVETQSTVSSDPRLLIMMEGMFPRGSNKFQFIKLTPSIIDDPTLLLDRSRSNANYYLVSSLMEANYIIELLEPPIQLNISYQFDNKTNLAKIASRSESQLYFLIQGS